VVDFGRPDPGFFERTADEDWEPFQRFDSWPDIDWSEPNLKFVDLTGDGLADILITEDGVYTLYPSLGEIGYGEALLVRTPWDEDRGPKVVMADGTETMFLADMSGDGLSDIVRVHNGEVSYWPNLGYGRFGTRVSMDHALSMRNDLTRSASGLPTSTARAQRIWCTSAATEFRCASTNPATRGLRRLTSRSFPRRTS
jgi:hypothetical protein